MPIKIDHKGNVMFPKVAILLLSIWLFLVNGNLDQRILSGVYLHGAMILVLTGFLVLFLFDRFDIPLPMAFFPVFFLYMYFVSLFNGGDIYAIAKVLVFFVVVLIASYCASRMSVEVFLKTLVITLFTLSFVNFTVIIAIPEIGVDVGFFEGDWKGVYDQKNSLGRLASLLTIASFLLFLLSKDFGVRLYSFLFTVAAVLFTYHSGSRTALASAVIVAVLIVGFCFLMYVYSRPIKDKKLFTSILMAEAALCLFFVLSSVYVVDLHTSYDGISVMGHFVSLTGRLTIWDFALENLSGINAWLGYGLDNFWTFERFSTIGPMQGMGDFYPHDSHSGYIDILIQGGWLAAFAYFCFVLFIIYLFFYGGLSPQVKLCAFGFFALFFFSNLTESYVTKSTNIVNFLFVYAVGLCLFNSVQMRGRRVLKLRGYVAVKNMRLFGSK